MDATVKAIFFLVAVVLAVIAAFRADPRPVSLFPLAFAVFVFPFMWDAFEAA